MKKAKLVLIFFALFCTSVYGASLKFAKDMNYSISYKEALAKAKNENKPIMMVIGTKTCPWCRKFERQTLKKDMINGVVKKEFIPLTLTRDKDPYPKQFNAKAVPTVFFINPKDESSFYISLGYKNKKDFKQELEKALDKYKTN